jgi:hypothetical protein
LRHNPIVSGDDQDYDISPCPARMAVKARTGRVQEGDQPVIVFHLVSADVLGNTAHLALRHVGVANGINKVVLP